MNPNNQNLETLHVGFTQAMGAVSIHNKDNEFN